ncbi:hypothetical protein SAMN04489729_2790 [Amycolatopsis lurida]|uniref:O-antigen/teichoic acid export membrane protein n=1 Tax=Amycolatopsis lurida NRRL 2430 TaxID=1460371 RepID=A0A2P2FNE0_AMYLU|nr:hypothetical protein [Amycolatopsis lurida]KFU78232.1 hypothetical protein BB31_26685 [Amycolatopsis lurida NRRL 2430]SEC91412.1 hypothetical protein SAMN04489729_2790 [Amycolatopsis lurida]
MTGTSLTGAGTASIAAPKPSMVLRLLAGRGAFRLAIQAMGLVLITAWGAHDYGRFATALGLMTWLNFVPSAAEKSALKCLPRLRMTRDAVAALAVRVAVVPVLVVLAAMTVALIVAPGSDAALYLTAAGWSICGGLLMTVSGLHRFAGKSTLDALAFTAGALVVGAVTVGTWFVRWSPLTHLGLLLAGILLILGFSAALLPRKWLRVERIDGHRLLPAFGRTTVLLGMTEVLDVLATSTVFGVLALAGRTVDSGPFYVALLAGSAFCSLLFYQLRVHQPSISARLRGSGAAAGRARAVALLKLVERGSLAFLVLVGIALVIPAARAVLTAEGTVGAYVVLGVFVLVETVLFAVRLYAGFLIENTNSKVLTLTASASIAGLVATPLAAAALVPAMGPVGGFAALVFAIGAQATVLRRLLRRHHPEL